METVIVTTNKTLEIPPKLAMLYGIRKGVEIYFVEERDHIKIFPITKEVIDRNAGFLGTKGKLLKALKKEKRIERVL